MRLVDQLPRQTFLSVFAALNAGLATMMGVGGGVQNQLLCQLTADACGRQVVAGPIEATALGNVLMQAIGMGRLSSVSEARELIRKAKDIVTYSPKPAAQWDAGLEKLKGFIDS